MTTEETTMTDTPQEEKLVEAKVAAASYSYFTRTPYELAPGVALYDPRSGQKQFSVNRHEAMGGETVHVPQAVFDLHVKEGFLCKPEDYVDPRNRPVKATPFGVPQPSGKDGELEAYQGPVLGDPRPTTENVPDNEVRTAGGHITPEQYAALERMANGETDEEAGDLDDTAYDSYMELDKEDLKTEVDDRNEGREDSDKIVVTRADGKDGDPLKPDYARALATDDEGDEDEEDED